MNNTFELKQIIGVVCIIIGIIIMYLVTRNISTTFNALLENKAKTIAINISNDAVNDKMDDIKYTDIVNVENDQNGMIKLVQVDTAIMNELLDDISNSLQEKMNNMTEEYVYLPIGSMFGSDILANIGPKIKINILPVADFTIDFESEFVENGINQTIHKIYIVINAYITIITPIKQVESTACNSILVGEVVIIGDVPSTYYNMESIEKINQEDTLNFE